MLSGLTPKMCIFIVLINNEPALTSTLATGIVQDTFAGEAGEGEVGEKRRQLEAASTATSTAQAGNSFIS